MQNLPGRHPVFNVLLMMVSMADAGIDQRNYFSRSNKLILTQQRILVSENTDLFKKT
jgi:hypothetical protein